MPTIYILIGLPGTGKSTYVRDLKNTLDNLIVVSTDDKIDVWAKENGLDYNHAFQKLVAKEPGQTTSLKQFEAEMFADLYDAVRRKDNIVVDRTNMTAKSRNRFLAPIPSSYRKVAVEFRLDDEELNRRLAHRAATEGKFIGRFVLDRMLDSYIAPSLEEFDAVYAYDGSLII